MGFLGLTMSNPSGAMSLTDAFVMAKGHDPQFKAAEADHSIDKNAAAQSYAAYLPTANYQQAQPPYSNTTIDYVTVSQPLFDATKLAALGQGPAKSSFAEANFASKEQDLALRTYKAAAQLMLAQEALAANRARLSNLQKLAERAKRLNELGQASVMEARDAHVRYELATADQLTLKTKRTMAEKQLAAITGQPPKESDFQLSPRQQIGEIRRLDELLAEVREQNPRIVAARDTETISKFEAARTKGQFLPVVQLTNTTSWGYQAAYNPTGGRISYTGISISLPLDAPSVIGAFSAAANAEKASEVRRNAEEQILLQAEELYQTVLNGHETLRIKRSAVEAAEVNVQASLRSAQVGVRTAGDVLSSIDTLYQAKNDYAVTSAAIGEAVLNLFLISSHPPLDSMAQVQKFLFGRSATH